MKQIKIIQRNHGRRYEVIEVDTESLEPVEIYRSLAKFGNYQEALDFKMHKLLTKDHIEKAIDYHFGAEER